jgi:hypothetical protein
VSSAYYRHIVLFDKGHPSLLYGDAVVSDGFVRGRRIEIPMTLSVTVGPKTWPAPWHGEVLLACRKCQKKLRKHPLRGALSKLKKIVKRRNREIPGAALHVIPVSCLKLRPKDAVSVCLPSRYADRVFILRSENDLDDLYR